MRNRDRFADRAADVIVVLVAVGMLGLYVADRPQASSPGPVGLRTGPERWRDETSTGIGIGPTNAQLTIVEFIDFECPFCAKWAVRVDSLLEEYPTQVHVVTHHFPLSIHPNALSAAVAVECADQQGHFRQFVRVLFANQDQMGTKPWTEYASEAYVPDIERFARCVELPSDSFPRIEYGISLGRRTGVRGTPTVWVNGVVQKPTLDEFTKMIAEVDNKDWLF